MKKNMLFFASPAFIAFLLFLSGCYKLHDINPDPTVHCKIEKIVIPNVFTGNDTVSFSYNTSGNPTGFTHRNQGNNGYDAILKYDSHQRLTDYISNPGNGFGDFWHHYTYAGYNSDKVLVDSNYTEYSAQNGVITDFYDLIITRYQYDSYGRISKTTEISHGNYGVDTTEIIRTGVYSYDAHGNLVRPGLTYDDKVSMNRTNKVWAFLNADYSANNPFISESYNSTGLPLLLTATAHAYSGFLDIYFTNANIIYSCP